MYALTNKFIILIQFKKDILLIYNTSKKFTRIIKVLISSYQKKISLYDYYSD